MCMTWRLPVCVYARGEVWLRDRVGVRGAKAGRDTAAVQAQWMCKVREEACEA